jgi:hypothetical protein
MISTKNVITTITDVPREWVFEFYLKLDYKLTGQDMKINSIFNKKDKNPSMYIYFNRRHNVYMYKDFSSDISGDCVDLVRRMFLLTTRGEAAHLIIKDYNSWLINNKDEGEMRNFKIRQKYQVKLFTTRAWTTDDQRYWSRYAIGSALLDKYNVTPLLSYILEKEDDDGQMIQKTVTGPRLYGYFRTSGELYKIYQPMIKDFKFMKVQNYIQGVDQLTLKVPYLIICSSMKDLLCFMKLGFKNAEAVAPDSENSMIPEHVIHAFKLKYKGICTIFDNDEPGIKAMIKYKEKYDLPFIKLDMEKDLSDSIEKHGIKKVREIITPLLKQTLNVQSEPQTVETSTT